LYSHFSTQVIGPFGGGGMLAGHSGGSGRHTPSVGFGAPAQLAPAPAAPAVPAPPVPPAPPAPAAPPTVKSQYSPVLQSVRSTHALPGFTQVPKSHTFATSQQVTPQARAAGQHTPPAHDSPVLHIVSTHPPPAPDAPDCPELPDTPPAPLAPPFPPPPCPELPDTPAAPAFPAFPAAPPPACPAAPACPAEPPAPACPEPPDTPPVPAFPAAPPPDFPAAPAVAPVPAFPAAPPFADVPPAASVPPAPVPSVVESDDEPHAAATKGREIAMAPTRKGCAASLENIGPRGRPPEMRRETARTPGSPAEASPGPGSKIHGTAGRQEANGGADTSGRWRWRPRQRFGSEIRIRDSNRERRKKTKINRQAAKDANSERHSLASVGVLAVQILPVHIGRVMGTLGSGIQIGDSDRRFRSEIQIGDSNLDGRKANPFSSSLPVQLSS
jgi:hypothetical protein